MLNVAVTGTDTDTLVAPAAGRVAVTAGGCGPGVAVWNCTSTQ